MPKHKYSDADFEKICKRIELGESVASICDNKDTPTQAWFYNTLNTREDLVERYRCARECQTELFLDDIIEIADNCTDDVEEIVTEKGNRKEVIKHSAISRARLQIDARKWAMSKLAPKKYGDSSTIKGDDENPLVIKREASKQDVVDTLSQLGLPTDVYDK